jgi:hypothetical protein
MSYDYPESFRDALWIIEEVVKVYEAAKSISDHSAFIRRDAYEMTEALREALGIEEL